MHWRVVPDDYYEKEQKKACMKQGTLDVTLLKMDGEVPQDFMKEMLLDAVAKLVVTDDQVRISYSEQIWHCSPSSSL